MGTAASAFPNPIAAELEGVGPRSAKLLHQVRQRRRTLAVQVVSYALGAAALLVYAYAGTISLFIPAAFFLCGTTLIGIFAVLSETHVNDRFDDHFLTVYQVGSHVVIQLGFLLAAPEIGYAFLNVLFLIFAVASLRMTSFQALVAWTLTAMGVAPIFLLTRIPLGLPIATPTERFAAALCFVLTIGQCAFVGLYGESLRKKLYRSSLKLKEAYRRIEELAELDELTGSYNRRCIMRMLGEEIARARRIEARCSIALIDLDWFKRINDAHGHPTGDEVLRTFAITMFANIRAIDRFGRYGGEEFLLVLPDTPGDTAMRLLDRLRSIIADLDWSAFSPGMQVTLSAGVTTLRAEETADIFLARADCALYAAKARGRNRVISA
jgi:diguanylate cyclase (GGDEF)-like protein